MEQTVCLSFLSPRRDLTTTRTPSVIHFFSLRVRNAPRQFGMRQPRPPPGAVSTAPVALACAFAAAYYTYGVHYSTAVTNSSSNATKTTPWWRPSN